MGVDYYHCDSCDESLYEEYVGWCQGCGNGVCGRCTVDNNIGSPYAHDYGLKFDSENPELMKKYEKEGFELYDKNGEPYYGDGDTIDDSSVAPKYCPFCTGKQIDRDGVLEYLLSKYGLKIEDVWKEMRK